MAAAGKKKRPVGEVVPPAFVAQEEKDGGAYDITEMPKRFAHRYLENKSRVVSERMRVLEAEDKWLTAESMRVLSNTRALIRKLDAEAEAAAPDAAAAVPAGQSS